MAVGDKLVTADGLRAVVAYNESTYAKQGEIPSAVADKLKTYEERIKVLEAQMATWVEATKLLGQTTATV